MLSCPCAFFVGSAGFVGLCGGVGGGIHFSIWAICSSLMRFFRARCRVLRLFCRRSPGRKPRPFRLWPRTIVESPLCRFLQGKPCGLRANTGASKVLDCHGVAQQCWSFCHQRVYYREWRFVRVVWRFWRKMRCRGLLPQQRWRKGFVS